MDNKNRDLAIKYIKDKINDNTFLSYIEIANITGFHPKYILRLKKEIIDGTIKLEHGNKLTEEERNKIINLYKKSHVSVRRFCKFYGSRSYSCIYNTLKEAGVLRNGN